MARSQAASTKKQKENKKLQQRKEKEQRKEERKANSKSGKTLEEMMAYVDENGNLTSVPPDPTKKRAAIKTDDIVIGARNNTDDTPANAIHTGKVTYFNTSKGYGFIKDDRTQESLFTHLSSMLTPVKENDRVSFHVERGPKGMNAVNVKKM